MAAAAQSLPSTPKKGRPLIGLHAACPVNPPQSLKMPCRTVICGPHLCPSSMWMYANPFRAEHANLPNASVVIVVDAVVVAELEAELDTVVVLVVV